MFDEFHMTHHNILTIDLGTSGPKAAVVSIDGTLAGSARASVATRFGPDGAAEQDAESVWQATVEATGGARRRSRTVVDRGDRGLRPVLVDRPRRRRRHAGRTHDHVDGPAGIPQTAQTAPRLPQIRRPAPGIGGVPARARPGSTLLGYEHQPHALVPLRVPDIYERTASFLEPVDYVTARLTGRTTANQCSAFMQMLADNRRVPTTGWHTISLPRR